MRKLYVALRKPNANQILVMSNAREVPSFRAELVVSRRLVGLLSAGHLGALVVGIHLSASSVWLTPICAAVALSWCWVLRRHALLRSPRSLTAVEIKGERACALRMRDGAWIHGVLEPTSYVLPWVVILHIAVEGRMFGLRAAIFPDSMVQGGHRRLRMRLRWANYDDGDVDRADPPL